MDNMERYKQLLSGMDWFYQHSDDYSVFCRGDRAMQEALGLQEKLDPEWSIWKQYEPKR